MTTTKSIHTRDSIASANKGTPTVRKDGWERAEALQRLGGDEILLQELCQIFVDESPKLLRRLRKSIAADDAEAMMRAAHSLKGELGYLGAAKAKQAAQELEDLGREKNMDQAAGVFGILEREVTALCGVLKDSSGATL
jgi:HPt (histidine-containing phosphotransfer) domain-containing protein